MATVRRLQSLLLQQPIVTSPTPPLPPTDVAQLTTALCWEHATQVRHTHADSAAHKPTTHNNATRHTTVTLTQTVRYEWVAPLDTDDGTTILPSDCAGGTDLPPPLELPCQRVSLESPVAIVVGALVLLLLLADCCAAAFVWHRRRVRRGIIQRSQPAFLLALCAGASFG